MNLESGQSMGLVTRILAVAVLAQVIVAIPHKRTPTNLFQQERNAVYNLLFGRSTAYKVTHERSPVYNKVTHERSPVYNKVTHERSPVYNKVTHERQVTVYPDEEAASIISNLVTHYHQYIFANAITPDRFLEIVNFLTGLQLEDPASTEPVMHDLLDSQFLRGVVLTLEEHGWVKKAVKTFYRSITAKAVERKVYFGYVVEAFASCDLQESWCAAGVEEWIICSLHLIRTAERIGLLSYDTNGTRTMNDILLEYDTPYTILVPDYAEQMEETLDNLDNFHSATSDQEQEQQCTELTQVTIEVWNDLAELNPEASQIYQKYALDWLGINMDSHQDIKKIICELIGRMSWSGFDGLYTTLLDSDILWRVIKHGYPMVVEEVNNADQMLDYMLLQISELDPDAPQVTPIKLAKRLIDIFKDDMGLMDLMYII